MKSHSNQVHNAAVRLRRAYAEDGSCDHTRACLAELKGALGERASLFVEIFAVKLTYMRAADAVPAALRALRQTQVRNLKAVQKTCSRQPEVAARQKAMAAHA
jgi:hypothetical protein